MTKQTDSASVPRTLFVSVRQFCFDGILLTKRPDLRDYCSMSFYSGPIPLPVRLTTRTTNSPDRKNRRSCLRLKQLEWIPVGIFQLDLLPARPNLHFIAEAQAGFFQRLNSRA